MADGTRIPLSLVNSTAPDFRLPTSYKLSELPFDLEEPGYNTQLAHFLSLCMKLVYEEDVVIQVQTGQFASGCLPTSPAINALIKYRR